MGLEEEDWQERDRRCLERLIDLKDLAIQPQSLGFILWGSNQRRGVSRRAS